MQIIKKKQKLQAEIQQLETYVNDNINSVEGLKKRYQPGLFINLEGSENQNQNISNNNLSCEEFIFQAKEIRNMQRKIEELKNLKARIEAGKKAEIRFSGRQS